MANIAPPFNPFSLHVKMKFVLHFYEELNQGSNTFNNLARAVFFQNIFWACRRTWLSKLYQNELKTLFLKRKQMLWLDIWFYNKQNGTEKRKAEWLKKQRPKTKYNTTDMDVSQYASLTFYSRNYLWIQWRKVFGPVNCRLHQGCFRE